MKYVKLLLFAFLLSQVNLIHVLANTKSPILSCMRPLGHHLYYKTFICPIGGEKFDSLTLGSHSTYGIYFKESK